MRTSVDSRLVSQSVGSSLHKGRHEAQLHVMLLQEGVFVRLPHLGNVAGRKEAKHLKEQMIKVRKLDLRPKAKIKPFDS